MSRLSAPPARFSKASARACTPQGAGTQHIMVVLGTRPEGIKLAPVIKALEADPRFTHTVVHTGQHQEMLEEVLAWFNITPHHKLNVMEPGQPLAKLSGKLLSGLHELMEQERPDIVMVQGDTTTAFMASLAAYYGYDYFIRHDHPEARRFIHITHVEAGLRTGDNYAPFPEEANRKLVGQLATYHFAPTQTAAQALFDENITEGVFTTGNTVIDALHHTCTKLEDVQTAIAHPLPQLAGQRYVLITGHRRESYGEGFRHICAAIRALAAHNPDTHFVYPVHLNKHVKGPVEALLSNIPNVHLLPPQAYPQFVRLMKDCHFILTDSGGLQEEGPSLGKPVLVMRELTERPDAVLYGTAKLVGTTEERIVQECQTLLDSSAAHAKMAAATNPYGDGQATRRILNLLAGQLDEDNLFVPSPPSAASAA